MHVTIVSPEETLFNGEAVAVKLPGEKGRFEVLEGHAPIVSTLTSGKVALSGSETFEVEVKGGFVEVIRGEVSVCVEC